MADAFSDLWQTSNPSQSQQKQTLRTAQAQQTPSQTPWARQAAKSDAFSILASASSTPPRITTPARSPAPPQPASRNGDAFGDLVSFGASSSTSNLSVMSLAAAAQQSRPTSSQSLPKSSLQQPSHSGALWDQLHVLGVSSGKATNNTTTASSTSDDPWDIDFVSAAPTQPKSQPATQRSSAPVQRQQASSNVFDLLGDFGEPAATPATTSSASIKSQRSLDVDSFREPSRSNTPGNFDFGDREYSGVNSGEASDDDILGVLAKPVSALPKRTSPAPPERTPSRVPSRTTLTSASGRVSPPPHLIGQIVEMGFSVEQARVALASTSDGLDVHAALEALLQAGGDAAPAPASFGDEGDSDLERERERERERNRRSNHDRRRRPDAAARHAAAEADAAASVTVQADKLLSQASEIGLSMLSKANTFWNAGKERVQKVYEERAVVSARQSSSSSPAPAKGRPRWMQEGGADEASTVDGGRSGFKDESDDEAPRPSRVNPPPASRPEPPPRPPPAQSSGSNSSTRRLVVDESKSTGGYRSPFRSGRQTQQTPNPQPSRGPSPLPAAAPAAPPPTFPGASHSVLSTVAAHKAKANEAFKLGSYPAAITSYNAALDLLPEGHMTRVSLLNNRALASIRIGEWKSAIEDCSTAISLIRPSSSSAAPPYLGPVPVQGSQVGGTHLAGETLHLGDALLKALSRRATAYEMGEKWPSAVADWNATLQAALLPMPANGGDIGKSRSEATRGVERCEKMVGIVAGGSNGQAPAPAPAPRPVRRPVARQPAASTAPSEAVQRLRAANAAASAEDQQKDNLKDSVDARLLAWKGGKETNIRALLASLDAVLWPELEWQTVGMAELIAPKQLKIKYMKAIAKLHPDKLNVSNTTVEQRMIANGVFATLNEAWDASNI